MHTHFFFFLPRLSASLSLYASALLTFFVSSIFYKLAPKKPTKNAPDILDFSFFNLCFPHQQVSRVWRRLVVNYEPYRSDQTRRGTETHCNHHLQAFYETTA